MEQKWEWKKAILIYGYNIFKKKLEGWPQTYYLMKANLELFSEK